MNKDFSDWIPSILNVAKLAASAIMDIYPQKNYKVTNKWDKSPVTEADLRSNHIIEQGLKEIAPTLPILSEEGLIPSFEERRQWKDFWLVDPLDGTKEFINGSDDFTVNIALIRNHKPILGVVMAPALKQYYWGSKKGAFFQQDEDEPQRIHVQKELNYPIRVAISRSHHDKDNSKWQNLITKFKGVEFIYRGSALKICLVARGEVDLYPRLGPTGEWDTAAGQCILEAAGGKLVDLWGRSFKYNARETLVNEGFFAVGCVDLLTYVVDNSD